MNDDDAQPPSFLPNLPPSIGERVPVGINRRCTCVIAALGPAAAFVFLLAAGQHAMAASVQIAAIELPFSRGGDAVSGVKRFFRNGCYEIESQGGPSGRTTQDRQVGCHLPSQVVTAFERLELLASATGGGIVREGRAQAGAGAGAGNQQSKTPAGMRAQIRTILVRADGSRWVAANDDVDGELLMAFNGLPSENQWYGKPPATPVGKGPQFVAVSIARAGGAGAKKIQGSLSADGRWWCHRSVEIEIGNTPRAQKLAPVSGREATTRLGRILKGARPKTAMDDDPEPTDTGGLETSVELVFAKRPRSNLFPKRLGKTVAQRFATEMSRQSPVCALP